MAAMLARVVAGTPHRSRRGTFAAALLGAGLLALLAVAAAALHDPATAEARKSCGKTTVKYSYGKFRFRVYVTGGKVNCKRARFVMRKGIPAGKPDPRGWYCRESRGRYSDMCRRAGTRKTVKATLV